MGFAEDAVHFFEGAVGGFGVEEVGYGDYEGVAAVEIEISMYVRGVRHWIAWKDVWKPAPGGEILT